MTKRLSSSSLPRPSKKRYGNTTSRRAVISDEEDTNTNQAEEVRSWSIRENDTGCLLQNGSILQLPSEATTSQHAHDFEETDGGHAADGEGDAPVIVRVTPRRVKKKKANDSVRSSVFLFVGIINALFRRRWQIGLITGLFS